LAPCQYCGLRISAIGITEEFIGFIDKDEGLCRPWIIVLIRVKTLGFLPVSALDGAQIGTMLYS
jgi:hypothetical protein